MELFKSQILLVSVHHLHSRSLNRVELGSKGVLPINKRLSRWYAHKSGLSRVHVVIIDDKRVIEDVIDRASPTILTEISGRVALSHATIHFNLHGGHGKLIVEDDYSTRSTTTFTDTDTALGREE